MKFFVDKFGVTASLAFIWVMLGIVGTMWVGELHFVTSLYFITQIVTTIGYGDIAIGDRVQLFICFYVLFGLCVTANVFNDVFNKLLSRAQDRLSARLRQVEEVVQLQKRGLRSSAVAQDIADTAAGRRELRELQAALAIFASFILFGAVFYSFIESCTCSYGVTHVAGCDRDNCRATGGYTKSFKSAVYMSVITLTTVGFGDVAPETHFGRALGIFWMIAGVLAFGNFVAAFSAWIDAVFHKDQSVAFGRKIFNRVDSDRNGYLTREEFTTWMLLKEGIVKQSALDDVNRLFESLASKEEKTPSGEPKLGFETLAEYFHAGDEDESDSCQDESLELTGSVREPSFFEQ